MGKSLGDYQQDPRKSPKRCVPVHKFPYPDFFSKFYPDSGGYLQIFGPYPDYDIYLEKKKKKTLNILKIHIKISPACTPTLLFILFRWLLLHYLDSGENLP